MTFNRLHRVSNKSRIKFCTQVGLDLTIIVATLSIMIYYLIKGDPRNRLMSCIGTVACLIMPYIVELFRGKRYSYVQHIIYTIYIVVSMFLGSVLNLHTDFAPMDEIAHVLFGYCGCLLFFYIFTSQPSYDNIRPLMATFLIFMASMGTAAVWEVTEFLVDLVGGQNALGYPPQQVLDYIADNSIKGFKAAWLKLSHVGVIDTITDICLHLCGSTLFAVQYYIHRKCGRNLLLGSMRREVASNAMNGGEEALTENDTV